MVDGNFQGTEEPRMNLLGSGRSVILDMSVSGDDAVQLPYSSISKVEIKGEAAVAKTSDDYYGSLPADSYVTLRQITVLAPDDGYLLAIGTCETYMLHSLGTLSSAHFGVSLESNAIPFEMQFRRLLAATLPNGARQEVVNVQGLFEVTQGMNTVYFLGYEEEGTWAIDNVYLTVVFIPSTCALFIPGPEDASSADPPVLSQDGVQTAEVGVPAEERPAVKPQDEAVSAHQEQSRISRLEHEISVMRAEMEALKQQMAVSNRSVVTPVTNP
jgi:hypothetical protein